MRSVRVSSIVSLILLGCASKSSEPAQLPTTDAGDAATDAVVDTGPTTIAGRTFGAFEPWAHPIDDYIAIGQAKLPKKFDSSINELFPHGGRMWIGYGDANYNMGTYTPIEFRVFVSSTDPTAKAMVVDGKGQGEVQTIPTQSGEEQIDRYRACGGNLWQAGIDSTDADELWTQKTTTPPAIAGNVYRLEGDTWKKFRSIPGGEHVHDLACFKGAVYMVGSGAKDRPEWESGQIFRYLWKSDDLGKTFSVAQRIAHPEPGAGDTRWINLLPTTNAMYLFGYVSTFATSSSVITNASTKDGVTVEDVPKDSPFAKIAGFGTWSLPDGSGIVTGVDLEPATKTYASWRVAADGTVTKLDVFAGRTIVDVHVEPSTNEIVFLSSERDTYPPPKATAWSLKVHAAPISNPNAAVEVAAHDTTTEIRSIAFWNGALYLGTKDGQILRAQ